MQHKKKVLIIDDEVDLCLLLKVYFVNNNYEVLVANTLTEGKLLIASFLPDIIVIDNNLPDGTGWDFAPRIAIETPSIFIVFITGYHQTPPPMPQGAKYRLIEKPISFADLDAGFASSCPII